MSAEQDTSSTLFEKVKIHPRGGLSVLYSACRALFFRELQTRFGTYRLGYLWAILEPGLMIGLKMILFGAIMNATMPGISYLTFLVGGMCAFFMVMRSATKNLSAVSSNMGLFSYQPVKPIAAVITRTFLEAVLYFGTFILFSFVLVWTGQDYSFNQIPTLFLYWFTLFIFSFGLSLVMCVIGDISAELGKLISACMIIFYIMSGVMFSINNIPVSLHGYLLWNPVLHALELIRHAMVPSYPIIYVSYAYVVKSTIIILFLGLLLYKAREQKMLKSK